MRKLMAGKKAHMENPGTKPATVQKTVLLSFIHLFIHTDVEPVIKGCVQQHLFTTQNNKIYPQ